MSEHMRHPGRHEWSIAADDWHYAPHFMAYTEKTAIRRAVEWLAANGRDSVRLYHSYPSPGPMNRYVGRITADGTLRRAI